MKDKNTNFRDHDDTSNDNPDDESFLNLKDPSTTDETKTRLSSKMSCYDEPKQ
jgi:hypothetical protein